MAIYDPRVLRAPAPAAVPAGKQYPIVLCFSLSIPPIVRICLHYSRGVVLVSRQGIGGLPLFPFPPADPDGLMGAAFPAVAAADALRAVGLVIDGDIQFAGPLAGAAAGTLVPVNFQPVKGDGMEQPVDRPQRAQIPAKRAGIPPGRGAAGIPATRFSSVNSQPATPRRGGFAASRGSPANNVPEGHRYLQNQGWPWPTMSSATRGSRQYKCRPNPYFRYFSHRSPGSFFHFLKKGIL